jgi:AbrB family looped-hinge helix DNA binding protein
MATTVSRLTRKYQATIPGPVREALGLRAGDAVAFDVDGTRVRVRKARPVDLAFARALEQTLPEWHSAEDDDAYRDL